MVGVVDHSRVVEVVDHSRLAEVVDPCQLLPAKASPSPSHLAQPSPFPSPLTTTPPPYHGVLQKGLTLPRGRPPVYRTHESARGHVEANVAELLERVAGVIEHIT